MPSRTLEDKVEELTKLTAAHREQIGNARERIQEIIAQQAGITQGLAELKTEVALLRQQFGEVKQLKEQLEALSSLKVNVAILERTVEELKQTKEEWSRRFWAMLGPILGAVVGVVSGYYLRR